MNITKNLNKIIDIIFGICLLSILLVFSSDSLLVFGIVPILLSIVGLDFGIREFLMILLGSLLVGLLITDYKSLMVMAIPLIVISILFIFLTKSNISDKGQIIISFAVISILLITLYISSMLRDGLTINQMANELKDNLEANFDYNIPIETYRISFSMFISILSSMSLIYSIFSLKVIRNYLSLKGKHEDMKELNRIRINKKDFLYIIVFIVIIYVVSLLMNIESIYVIANLLLLITMIFVLNGLSVYDFLVMKTKSPISKGFQWIFIIVFRYFFILVFLLLGIADVFIDLRNKVRRPSAKL